MMEHPKKILVVSASDSAVHALREMLDECLHFSLTEEKSGSRVRRALPTCDFDLAIINMPLSDESGIELAERISADCETCVILLAPAEHAGRLTLRLEQSGISVLPKPISRQAFLLSVRLLLSARGRLTSLREENRTLRRKLEETKLVCRAKCLLVMQESISEEDAHRRIEKQAMDNRLPRVEIARQILDRYDRQK